VKSCIKEVCRKLGVTLRISGA